MKTAKAKLQISSLDLIIKTRRELPPPSKPFVDKKRQSKLDKAERKVKHKKQPIL
jgi:hypothetical protein